MMRTVRVVFVAVLLTWSCRPCDVMSLDQQLTNCRIGSDVLDCSDMRDDMQFSDENRLTQFMLQRYKRAGRVARPLLNASHPIEIEFSLSLIQILDLDAIDQALTSNVWKRYRWVDHLLRWNPADYGGITNIRLPPGAIWTPDIVLYNTAAEQEKTFRELVTVNATGYVTWIPPAIYKSSCELHMRNFPYDEQYCYLKFGSWTYDVKKLTLALYDGVDYIDQSEFVDSSEWTLSNTRAQLNTRYYNCCGDDPYQDLTFQIWVRRRTAFYVYVLILPSLLLSFLTTVLFWIPPQRPDRTSFGMSLFSSFFVLLLILVQSSPPTSASISLLGVYYCINMVMIALSTLVSAVVINITHHLHSRPVPRLLRYICIDLLSWVLCARGKLRRQKEAAAAERGNRELAAVTSSSTNGGAAKTSLTSSSANDAASAVAASDNKSTTEAEWKTVAKVIDRFFFLVYLLGIFLSLTFVFPR